MPLHKLHYRRLILILVFTFCTVLSVFAQKTREELQREKAENQSKIKEIQNILQQTSSQKNVNLGQLRALNQQINTYKKQIDLLSDDLEILDRELKVLQKKQQELAASLAQGGGEDRTLGTMPRASLPAPSSLDCACCL